MRIALILNDDFSMYHFRSGLIRALLERGFEVFVIVPPGHFIDKLEALGARSITIPMARFISPMRDLLLIYQLYRIFKARRFDLVHTMTIKPNIYGTITAKLAGVRRIVCLVSGKGFMLGGNFIPGHKYMKWGVIFLLKLAMRLSHKIWFQNPDDYNSFVQEKIIDKEKGIVIRSGGINIKEYSPSSVTSKEMIALKKELKIPVAAKCVLMVTARMIWSKGVREFVEAAISIHDKHPEWFFIMVCPKDSLSPDAVPTEYIYSHRLERLIVIDSFRYDIKVFEAISDIMVLPSYYPEGVPRSLLEGLALAKPIITTDHPGCREVVEEGRNGFLIPVRNPAELANRLEALMTDPIRREEFGRYSRVKAQREFSEEIVVKRIIEELYALPVA